MLPVPRQFLCAGLEQALNLGLPMVVEWETKLARLSGKRLELTVTDGPISLVLNFHADRISVHAPEQVNADAHILASLQALPLLRQKSQLTRLIQAGKLDIQGDLTLAQEFSELLSPDSLDVENWLSGFTGDVVAYRLGQLGRAVARGGARLGQKLDDDGKDLLVDELAVAIERGEYERFADQVDDLAGRVESLQQTLGKQ